jgi:hypothetical protein
MSTDGQSAVNVAAVDELLDALEAAADLDEIHRLVSQKFIECNAPPRLSAWLINLINTERRRRDTGNAADYPIAPLNKWPALPLASAARAAIGVAAASADGAHPTSRAFAFALVGLFVATLAWRCYLEETYATHR